ncbi:hypothetical protein HA402_012749 [Bradysia odoriphaga]|nr:hypothetical protein HA402_012749 [Bradysia odoriphaga]
MTSESSIMSSEHCRRFPFIEVVPEPVSVWTDIDGVNILDNFYRDPVRWAFTFQSLVGLTCVENHLKTALRRIRVTERSIGSIRLHHEAHFLRSSLLADSALIYRNIFLKAMTDDGYLEPGMTACSSPRASSKCVQT